MTTFLKTTLVGGHYFCRKNDVLRAYFVAQRDGVDYGREIETGGQNGLG